MGKEKLSKNRWGLWVELKTTDRRGAPRIERGLFAPPSFRGKDLLGGGDGSNVGSTGSKPDDEGASESDDTADRDADLVLVRYQAMSGAKLYEYPVGAARHARAGGDVSTFELFEYDPTVTPVRTTLGPDTLRFGNRVIPSTMERVRRYGTDEWPSSDDSTGGIQRLVLTQTFWRNGAVPLTGFARSFFKAEMRRLPWSTAVDSLLSGIPRATRPDSTLIAATQRVAAQADSLLNDGVQEAPAPTPSTLAWTELTLSDLGSDAKPEVNQLPELAPDLEETDTSGFQR